MILMATLINLDDAADYDEDSNDNDVGYKSVDSFFLTRAVSCFRRN